MAGTDYVPTMPPPVDTPMPTFRVEDVETRKSPSGLNIALFGGATVDQSTDAAEDINPTFGPGIPEFDYNPKSKIGGLGGIKIGYTWDPALNPNYVDEGAVKLMPAIEAEAFYLGYQPSGSVNTSALVPGSSGSAKSDIDSAIFSVNGLMKFEIGIFRPYIGAGVGGAYMSASKAAFNISGPVPVNFNGGNAEEFVLAAQAIAGLEITLTQNWALFGEYKFLYLNDPKFDFDGYTEHFDYIGHQIVSAGVRYYFY